jgi:hypothetical protein
MVVCDRSLAHTLAIEAVKLPRVFFLDFRYSRPTQPRGEAASGMAQGKAQALFWLSTVLAGLSVILVISNGLLFLSNQETQATINRRQQFINQSVQLGRLNEALVRALATAAANNKDDQLRELLAQHGITFQIAPADGQAPAASGKQ